MFSSKVKVNTMSRMKSFRYWMAVVSCALVLLASGGALALAQEENPAAPAVAESAPAASNAVAAPATEAPAETPAPTDEASPADAAPAPEPTEEAAAPETATGAADEAAAPAETAPVNELPAVPAPADEVPAGEAPLGEGPEPESDLPLDVPAETETPAEGDAPVEAETPAGGAAAAEGEGGEDEGMSRLLIVAIVIAVIGLPLWIGGVLARSLRMPDYGWKIATALLTLTAGAVVCYFGWPPQLGPDLSGGINLIYEVSPDYEGDVEMEKLIGSLARRINPSGVKEVMIRPYGERQVEIIIPKADDAEVELVKNKITTAGMLEFRIVANPQDHAAEIEAARQTDEHVVEIGGTPRAKWVKLSEEQFDPQQTQGFITRQNVRGETEVLVVLDNYNVTGEYLDNAAQTIDQRGRPAVGFNFNSLGDRRFSGLTTENAPNPATGFKRLLGIVLDETLLSAPQLNEPIVGGRGEISGDFTEPEVEFLVSILNAGSLPATLNETPISEQITSPTLGADTVRSGAWAMGASLIAVMIFMVIYYHLFAGTVACLALFFNLVLLLAVMILINAAFTLPGIAGLVLTIGMAVDANVLIYERIREELSRGAALRMAIRNGFGRATTTIVDANVTTLITAIVLYWIGTDQIKGFAVTLILGILMSMYTAIFLGRLLFDIAERKRWITSLSMMQLLGSTHYDFLGKRRPAMALSLLMILVGITGVVVRGETVLDIDFTGGSSVTVAFNDPQEVGEVRSEVAEAADRLEEQVAAAQARTGAADVTPIEQQLAEINVPIEYTVVGIGEDDKLYKIDTSIQHAEIAQQMLREQFGERLLTNRLSYEPPRLTAAGGHLLQLSDTQPVALLQDAEAAPDAAPADAPEASPAAPEQAAADEAAEHAPAAPEPVEQTGLPAQAADAPADAAASRLGGDEGELKSTTTLQFGEPIKHDTLVEVIQNLLAELELPEVPFTLENPEHLGGSDVAWREWELTIELPPEQTTRLLGALETRIEAMTVFPSTSNIGSQVAGDTQVQAGYALFASLLIIVGYIWLRFQRVMYGLAAVAALVHDVVITLGVLALSKYLVDFADPVAAALLIDPFKISLSIVAALLTVVGYSLNDTIVVFDRIREMRGKSPHLTAEMINASINQTLSRTLLTSGTTLLVVIILYIWGGPGIHGFAFSLLIGIGVGTYSSIFIASPILLWMSQPGGEKPKRVPAEPLRA